MCGQALLKKIEDYRNKMVSLAASSSFSNQEVIRISKELDDLLNQYHQYANKK